MPKVNVYLPDELAAAVRDAGIPVSAVCQAALERAVREVSAARSAEDGPPAESPEASTVGLFGRFTPRARQAVVLARQAALAAGHNYVGTEHVLIGVLDEGTNLALKVLERLDVEVDDLRAEMRASMGPPSDGTAAGHVPFTPRARQVLEHTAKEALRLGHNYIGCEHILLGLLATEDGLASKVMRRMGMELRTTRLAVTATLSGFVLEQLRVPRPNPVTPPPAKDEPAKGEPAKGEPRRERAKDEPTKNEPAKGEPAGGTQQEAVPAAAPQPDPPQQPDSSPPPVAPPPSPVADVDLLEQILGRLEAIERRLPPAED